MMPPQEQGKILSRRSFLVATAEVAASTALAACGAQPPTPEKASQAAITTQVAVNTAIVFDQQTKQPKPTDEEPEATQIAVSPDVQAQIDANPDLQVMIADMEWDGGSQGYVKKDASGNITEWLNVYEKEKVRVTQVVTLVRPNGKKLTVYSGTPNTREEEDFWAKHQDYLGEPPVNPGVITGEDPNIGEMGQYFAGWWENALAGEGVDEEATFTWYSEDGVEHTSTVSTDKVFISNSIGPKGFIPGETQRSVLNDKKWTTVSEWHDDLLVNKQFPVALSVNIAAQGNMPVIHMLSVSTTTVDEHPNVTRKRLVATAMAVAIHALKDGKVMDDFELGAYQKEKGGFSEVAKKYYMSTTVQGTSVKVSPQYSFDITK